MSSNQIFKAVYFSDYKETNPKAKGVILAFGERNKDLYKSIANLGSNELRNLLGTDSFVELEQRAKAEGLPVNTYCLWYLRKNLGAEETQIEPNKNRVIVNFPLLVLQVPTKLIMLIHELKIINGQQKLLVLNGFKHPIHRCFLNLVCQ